MELKHDLVWINDKQERVLKYNDKVVAVSYEDTCMCDDDLAKIFDYIVDCENQVSGNNQGDDPVKMILGYVDDIEEIFDCMRNILKGYKTNSKKMKEVIQELLSQIDDSDHFIHDIREVALDR